MQRFFQILSLCAATLLLHSHLLSAVELPKGSHGGVILRWVDVHGKMQAGPAVKRMAWVWSQLPEDGFESPALRLSLSAKLPKDWRPQKITGDGLTLVTPYEPGNTQDFTVDMRSGKAILRFEFLNAKGEAVETTLLIQASVPNSHVIIHENCHNKELKFNIDKRDAKHLFVGLNCDDHSDSIDLYFFRSKDSHWNTGGGNTGGGLVQFDPENKFTAFKFHAAKPAQQVTYDRTLFRVGTADEHMLLSEYSVIYTPKNAPQRFTASAGIGVTTYQYNETLDSLSIRQISITGKASAGYRLIPKVLDIAFNMFGNLVALWHSPTSYPSGEALPSARFYGINGRLGYRLPIALGATEFMFLTGWYFWGMIVPETASGLTYGLKQLAGPQLFITVSNNQKGSRGRWAYVKYAFISDGFGFSKSGYEMATGGGINIFPAPKPWSATLDIAYATFSNDVNGLKLLSITAGVQKPF